MIFSVFCLLLVFTTYGQEKKQLQRQYQKNSKVTAPVKINTPSIKTTTLKVNPVIIEKDTEDKKLRKAYNWLAPFRNYGMIPIESITSLKHVDLATGSPVVNGVARNIYMSDDSLAHLKAFTGLETVVLPIWTSNNGLKHIGEMNGLKGLYLGKMNINDAGLAQIAKLDLEKLILFETNITNNGVTKIVEYFPNLKILNLSNTNITNDGLKDLKNLNKLESLIIKRNNITDAAIPHLIELKHLKLLSIEFNQISTNGKNQLRTAFPNITLID